MKDEQVLDGQGSPSGADAKPADKHRLASPWLSHLIEGPLWPTEGSSRGNDVYALVFSILFFMMP